MAKRGVSLKWQKEKRAHSMERKEGRLRPKGELLGRRGCHERRKGLSSRGAVDRELRKENLAMRVLRDGLRRLREIPWQEETSS